MKKKLNFRQQRFCVEYAKDFNGAAAAVRSGYSEKTARAIASENLTKPDIAAEISALVGGKLQKELVTVDEVISEVKQSAFTPLKTKAVKDKLRALELLGKYLKLWGDDRGVQVDVQVNLAQIRQDLLGMETKVNAIEVAP